jgi:hypothetical protein
MLKPAQHDKKNYVIPNLFRNLEFSNDNELIAFVLVCCLRPRSLRITKSVAWFMVSLPDYALMFSFVTRNPENDSNVKVRILRR